MAAMDSPTLRLDDGANMLLRALGLAGGIEALARHLRVPKKQLAQWIDGEVATPDGVFMRVIDFLRVGAPKKY
jgi:hypothetical protein